MKYKIYIWAFGFGLVSLIISIFQFVNGSIWEAILSLTYFSVFTIGGILNRQQSLKNRKNEKEILQ